MDVGIKIGLDITCTSGNRTGIGIYAANLVKALLQGYPQDHFELYAYSRLVKISGLEDLTTLRPHSSVRIMRRSQIASAVRWNVLKTDPIENTIGNVDVVHGLFHLVPRTRQAKRLVTIYDLAPFLFPETGRRISNLLHRYLIRSCVKSTDVVFTISHAVKNEVSRFFDVPLKKIHVAYPGVEDIAYEDYTFKNEFLDSLGIFKPYIIFVSTIQPRKGIKTLLDAYTKLRRVHSLHIQLVVLGNIGWESKAVVETMFRLQQNDELVHLVGKDDWTKLQLIHNAQALVMPSLYEGFGIPIAEAMNAGCPVIASDIPVFREIAQDAALFFPVGDSSALAEQLCNLLEDKLLEDRLCTKGRTLAKQYSVANCACQVHSVYQQVIS